MDNKNEFYKALEQVRQEMVGKVIGRPGYTPVGRVIRVDEQGAWLDKHARIAIEGIAFYHPVNSK
jgi:hypothetical protein